MAKSVDAAVLDPALNHIKNNATRMVVCAGQPTSYDDVTTRRLAESAMASGDFTLAAGDVSGRKVTSGAKNGITITTSGTADHVVWCSATAILVITTCTSQALSTGGTVDVPGWKYEINNPT